MTDIQIYSDHPALIRAATEHIITQANAAINQHGRFTLALSGGSTPRPVYEQLAAETERIDWTKVHLYWSDERTVPPNNPDSNYHMAHEALLRHIEHECGNIHRIRGEIDPAQAALEYEAKLRVNFPDDGFPGFDQVLIGMGDDGHTASLFPHTAALNETERWVVANQVEKLQTWRITFTAPLINAAHQVTFLISGDKKAAPVYEVLQGASNPQEYPSQLIHPVNGQLTYLLDTDAANLLKL
ncbi:MAG: 6-phosphogluconolactonase [Anaerolineae bacterium]|nr:6-phosphogluconolactonase [Anaerolineae bacterium]